MPEDAYDPMWQRLALSLLFLVLGVGSFIWPWLRRQYDKATYFSLLAFNTWALHLAFENDFSTDYLVTYLLSIVASSLIFQHFGWMLAFISTVFGLSLAFYPLLDDPVFPAPNFYASEAAAMAIILIANRRMLREKDQLVISRERLRVISRASFDFADAGIIVTDLEGHTLQYNDLYLEMWGLAREEMEAGRKRAGEEHLLELLEDPEVLNEGFHRALAEPEQDLTQELVLKDGRIIERRSRPLVLRGSAMARIWYYRDITADKRELQSLVRKREELAEQNRLLVRLAGTSALPARALKETLHEILFPGMQQLKVAQVSVWRMEPDGLHLVNIFSSGNAQAEKTVGDRLDIRRHSVFFDSIRHTRIMAISNALEDFQVDSFRGEYPILAERAQLDVPIREKGVCTGLISFQCSNPVRAWTLEQMSFASSLGDLVQLAIESSRRMEAEEEVFQTNAILNSVFERSGIGITVTDSEANLLAYNGTFVEMWGLTEEMLQPGQEGKIISQVISQIEGDPMSLEEGFAMVKGLPPNRYDLVQLVDGRLLERFVGELDLGTGRDGRIWYYRDITKQTRQEMALRKSEERNRAILSAVPDLLVLMDEVGRIIDLKIPDDPVFEPLRGRSFGYVRDILPRELTEQVRVAANEVLATGDMQAMEIQISFLGQELDLEVRILPSGASELLLILRDVTQRKITERELLQRNFELDSFVYRASHDLKAPLNSLMGLIDILKLESPSPETLRYISLMDRSVQKLDTFIRNLTDFSRITRLDLNQQEIDLEGLFAEVEESLKYMENADKVAQYFELEQECPFYGDRFHLGIVLSNLISNAIKYQDHSKEENWVKVRMRVQPEKVRVEVEDNGIGIPHQHLDKLFELFFRASNQSFGSGLGLYITQNAVEKMEGGIVVNSKEGEGTVFSLFLRNYFEERTMV